MTMAETLSKDQRSALMARVKSRNTTPEKYVRRTLWTNGFRYRLNVRKLPGKPDIVLAKYRTATLVQGCFWHSHDCRRGRNRPATNIEYWNRKLDGNAARDAINQAKLVELGWYVFTIWECELQEGTERLLSHLHSLRERQEVERHGNPSTRR